MFKNKEYKLLEGSYFRIIKEGEQYIELQSICTGDCWNIFKNQFEKVNKISLYHKKKVSSVNYERHCQCRNVQEAVSAIKNFDAEIVRKKEAKRNNVADDPTERMRKLKVYEASGYSGKTTPTIILKGNWLDSWGFEAGDQIEVTKEKNGKLTISVAR